MAFEINAISETSESVEVGETLWLKADRETVVKDGDPEAAFLLATPGKRMSREDALRYGLVKPSAEEKKAAKAEEAAPEEPGVEGVPAAASVDPGDEQPAEEAGEKQQAPAKNKKRTAAKNK